MIDNEHDEWINRARRLQNDEEWRVWKFLNPLIRTLNPAIVQHRKLRLFTAACLQRLADGPHLGEQGWVVEMLERQADTPSISEETQIVAAALREVRLRCTDVMGGMYWQASIDYSEEPETAPWQVAWATAEAVTIAAGRRALIVAGLPDGRPEQQHRNPEERRLCDLVRCIFCNPFQVVNIDPTWRTSTAINLATGIYEDRAYDRMPILADALQDAGCGNEDILGHCRGDNPHARGCWVVDAVLNKE